MAKSGSGVASGRAPTAPCGCGCGGVEGGGRKAVHVDPELKAANLNRLRRIEGQVRGLIRMVEEDRYCADIVTQVSAVRESLQSVAKVLLKNHLRHCARAAISKGDQEAEAMCDELLDLMSKLAR